MKSISYKGKHILNVLLNDLLTEYCSFDLNVLLTFTNRTSHSSTLKTTTISLKHLIYVYIFYSIVIMAE